jgi:hypothetical protein
MNFLSRLFGTPASATEDHLTGAVDLSDADYCLSLLPREADQ